MSIILDILILAGVLAVLGGIILCIGGAFFWIIMKIEVPLMEAGVVERRNRSYPNGRRPRYNSVTGEPQRTNYCHTCSSALRYGRCPSCEY